MNMNFYPPSSMHQSIEYENCLYDYLDMMFGKKSNLPLGMLNMAEAIITRCIEYADDGIDPLECAFLGGYGEEMDEEINVVELEMDE